MKTDLKILMLETDDHEVERIKEQLRKGGIPIHVHRAENQAAFLDILDRHKADLILSDHRLPAVNGFEVLALARHNHPEVPFVMVTGLAGTEKEIESLEKSGVDYVLKNRLSRLVPVVQRALHEAVKRKEQRKLEQALVRHEEHFRALVDSITDYAICRLDGEGNISSWNTGAERVNGFTAPEMIGQHFSCIYPDEPMTNGLPGRALEQAAAYGHFQEETMLLRKGGMPFWANVSLTLLPEQVETPRGFALVVRDVTARKHTEVERERRLEEFQSTLTDVKILSGLVPLCASCKKVRDYKGHWHPLEAFLREHSEATLTHEFCVDCAQHIQPVVVEA